ncbi:MAG: molybdopterin-synthase adenylyltransferase MoeB [Anaerolineales bacterium]|nr:molybdopterin-synthase adenylyltransferase MoeB [Anaerolineales bacterium]
MLPPLTPDEVRRYSRHLLLPEVGLDGQRKLKAASVLVVGMGGLGSPVALYLAAAGVGCIGLVDYDAVEESNLQRQVLYGTAAVGQRKVDSARRRLVDLNPAIQVDAHDVPFTSENAIEIATPYDVIVDGTDNFPTRYLANDLCVLTGRPLVYGAVYRFDGQVSVFDARTGPCYRCLFPEPPAPWTVPSCAEGGVLGVLPGTIGTIQATATLKILLGLKSGLDGTLLLYDAFSMSFETIRLKKNPHCKVCGPQAEITTLIDYFHFCSVPGLEHPGGPPDIAEMTVAELADLLKGGVPPLLVDVREPHELAISYLPGAMNLPLGTLATRVSELDPEGEIVVFCRTGVRSARALELLSGAGFRKVKNLRGGINAWARQVDPNLPVY